jgi:hypothetical protein
MNQNVPSVTLQTAVLMQVKEFAAISKPFSIHDVTRAIRSKTSQGEVEIPEVEVAGASFRFDIPHSKVKGIFDELWRTGVFDPTFTLDRQFTGMFYEYTPQSTGVSAPSVTFAAPVSVPTTNSTVTTPPAPSKTSASEIAARVKLYLLNCTNRNFRPTIRNVQSAIKRNDCVVIPSCENLKDCIESLGYIMVVNPNSVSKSQVVTA